MWQSFYSLTLLARFVSYRSVHLLLLSPGLNRFVHRTFFFFDDSIACICIYIHVLHLASSNHFSLLLPKTRYTYKCIYAYGVTGFCSAKQRNYVGNYLLDDGLAGNVLQKV